MDRRETAKVSARATDELMALSGVVSVGIGPGPDGGTAVIVGVSTVSAEMRAVLPERIEGVPVIIREVGEIGAR